MRGNKQNYKARRFGLLSPANSPIPPPPLSNRKNGIVSPSIYLSFLFLPASFPPSSPQMEWRPKFVSARSVGVCGEPASLLFLMYENLCTLRGGGRRRKKGTQPRISTSSSVSLSFFLDACFLFTPFPPLFTRRLAPSPTPAKPLFFPSSFFLSPVSFPSFFAWIGRIERSRHPL